MPVIESFLAFLDVETTGVIPGRDEVSEVGTILTDLDLQEIDRIEMKVQLRHPNRMSPKAAQINGYDPDVWAKEAKPFREWKDWLAGHIPRPRVAIPIGHNVGFDRDIIDAFYYKPAKEFFKLSYHKVDTIGLALALKLAGILNVSDVKLPTVREALGIGGDHHRAMGDCLAVKQIFELFLDLLRKGNAASPIKVHESESLL